MPHRNPFSPAEESETSKDESQKNNNELTVIHQEPHDEHGQIFGTRLYAESIITTIREPLIILDKDLRIKSASASFYKNFNLTEDETEGQFFYELQNGQWNDKELRRLLSHILPEKTSVTDFEIAIHFKSLGWRNMLLNAKQVANEKNGGQLILLAIEDITDRKEKEKLIPDQEIKFRKLADNVRVMIWTATPDGKKNYFNQYLFDYTGLTFDKLEGDGWHQYVFPGDLERTITQWRQSVEEGNDFKIEIRIRRHDGEYCWFLSQATAQKDSAGKITGWVGTKTEIEDQKAKEKQKDDFISIASHELKTPITSLNGYIYVLKEIFASSKDQASIQLLDKASKQTNKLVSLINTLLDITKIKQGVMELNQSEFDIDDLVREVCEEMKAGATNHTIEIDLQAKQNITGDRQKIEDVLTNLISNAIKYSPKADKIVLTSTAGDDHVSICVQDFRLGISKEMQGKIFERFFRINDENMESFPRLGLGLVSLRR